MLLLRCCALLSLWRCSHAATETTMLYSESGERVTLRCSSAGCPSSIVDCSGMYLYRKFMEFEEQVLFHSFKPGRSNVVSPQGLFKGRTQVEGTLQDQNITISNLSVHDSGLYSCVFASFPDRRVRCNTYLLAVKGVSCDVEPTTPSGRVLEEERPSLVLPVTVTCAATALVILACLLLGRLVRKWMRDCRRARNPPEPNDYVYEVMTKDGLCPLPSQ